MKRFYKISATILLCGMLVSMLFGCDNQTTESKADVSVNNEVSTSDVSEDATTAIALGMLIFVCGCFVIVFGVNYSSKFDNSKWSKHSKPSFDARIIDIQTNSVKYVKNEAKYKTVVRFSDGFIFTTHATNREDKFFSYRISINADLSKQIIENAIAAHEKAVFKELGKPRIQKNNDHYIYPQNNNPDPFAVYHQKPHTSVEQKKRTSLHSWVNWFFKPHYIVAIIGIVASIMLNIYIPQEKVFYLITAMGLMFIEYLLMGVINAIWGIPGKIVILLPYILAVVFFIIIAIVFEVFAKNPNYIDFDFMARISPFAATISLAMWAKHLWEET